MSTGIESTSVYKEVYKEQIMVGIVAIKQMEPDCHINTSKWGKEYNIAAPKIFLTNKPHWLKIQNAG